MNNPTANTEQDDSDIVTPENTALIANWTGYRDITIVKNFYTHVFGINIKTNEHERINFITNSDQSREVEEKLLRIITPMGRKYKIEFLGEFVVVDRISDTSFTAKTLPLVIYKAALYEAKK